MNFDAATVEPSAGFEPLPEGSYLVMVIKAEEKTTKSGTGVQLVVEMRVLEGPRAGRNIYSRINIQNASPKCTEIGRGELSALCRATGILTPKNAFEFCNKTLVIDVKVAQRSDGKGMTNEVSRFKPAPNATVGLVQNGTSAPSQPAATAPWAK